MKTATLVFASIVMLSVYGETGGHGFRPYISTSLAKIVMTGENEVTEECDGSGWITHGDGHKTECVGCPACGKGDLSSFQEDPKCQKRQPQRRTFRPLRSLLELFR